MLFDLFFYDLRMMMMMRKSKFAKYMSNMWKLTW